ncbi:hypothetical protein VE03_01997 [Pseudogymnoascus sp. 23342-1-I1]|nr:hypothetical protein VE03_01997 [Pseudogymnoascus sp. 23342-1-I1]
MTSRTTYPIPHRTAKNAAARLDVHGPDDGLSYSLDTISPSTDDTDHDVDPADDDAHERTRLTAPPDDAERHTTSDLETTSSESTSTRMSKAPLLMRTSPGMGTGSYGAAPVGHSTDEEEGEGEEMLRRRNKKAGSRHTVSTSRRRRRRASGSDAGGYAEGSGAAPSPTSTRRPSISLGASTAAMEGVEGFGMESRFGVGKLPVSPGSEHSSKDGHDEDTDPDDLFTDEDPPDNSRYSQVRASVSALDDLSLSINTPRMWTLSMLFATMGSATNLFFSLRYPSVSITPVIALLLVHPLGLIWDRALKRSDDPEVIYIEGSRSLSPSSSEDTTLDTDSADDSQQSTSSSTLEIKESRRRRLRLWLAQGRWNEKEHSCVYIASNVAFGFAFATDVIVEQTHFYNQPVTITYQVLLILSTQILGYAFAGLSRRFLVRPGGMIWPGTLMPAAMFTTLHKEENSIANGWTISRWKFFFVVWLSAFAFYFLPGLLMPALSYFNVITWFWPDNVVVANLFGVSSGLGLFPVTFDWAQIAYIGSPLTTPFWAAMNVVGGLVVVMWIIAPICYYNNVFYSAYMPILSSVVFDNTGKMYDVARILTPDFLFDRDAYEAYSRVFMPITYILSYGLQFAALASLLTHTACWHGRDIVRQWRNSLEEVRGQAKIGYEVLPGAATRARGRRGRRASLEPGVEDTLNQEDVHNRLMRRYNDAPMWWYLATFVSMTAIGIFVVEYYPVHLPWYGLLLALALCALLFIPTGIVAAITNQHSSTYLINQIACGALFPGRPVANMVFVTYGYICSAQGIKFSSDLKLGHYMKIPPRLLFSVQMAATLVSSLTQISVLNWMFANVRGICTTDAVNGFSCPLARVHFNGSILWGVVGPGEFFGPNATYRPLVWCFLIGAIAPIPLWWYSRHRKSSIVRHINLPVLFGSLSWIPPATGLNFSVWAVVCYIFNYRIRRSAGAWWAKYTMTLSAALDSGLAFGVVVIFFGVLYPGWAEGWSWWGTEVYKRGCDWRACSWLRVGEGERFGPDRW